MKLRRDMSMGQCPPCLGAHEDTLGRVAADVEPERTVARSVLVDERRRPELLDETPQLALAGRTLLHVHEVHGQASLGEEALGLARVPAVEKSEDLDCCSG